MTGGRYERACPDLPWGWWMRAGPRGLEDGEGGVWPDFLTAFWEGRLGMKSGHLAGEQQERMLRVLTSLGTSMIGSDEERRDLFGGDDEFWPFYMCWLSSVGLTTHSTHAWSVVGRITEEGRAVAQMLRVTREPAGIDLPMREVVDAVRRAGRGAADDAREAALRAFERGMTPLLHAFARERAGRAHLVTLTSIDPRDRMPMRRVAWSASFLNEGDRDDLFGWLAQRVHRWEHWGDIARSKGAAALTAHLLGLLVASSIGGVGGADASGAGS